MKCLKIILLTGFLLCGPLIVHGAIYRYYFIPTGSNLYPLSDYLGTYIDLTSPSGAEVNDANAIADWHFVTPQGMLNGTNNVNNFVFSLGQPSTMTMSWNSSTITSFSSADYFRILDGNVSIMLPNTTSEKFAIRGAPLSRQLKHYPNDTITGYWQAETFPVPEPNSFPLMLLTLFSISGFFLLRRKLKQSKA